MLCSVCIFIWRKVVVVVVVVVVDHTHKIRVVDFGELHLSVKSVCSYLEK